MLQTMPSLVKNTMTIPLRAPKHVQDTDLKSTHAMIPMARFSTGAGTYLVLLKVVGEDVVLAQADIARDRLLAAHDQPQQCALPATIGPCKTQTLPAQPLSILRLSLELHDLKRICLSQYPHLSHLHRQHLKKAGQISLSLHGTKADPSGTCANPGPITAVYMKWRNAIGTHQ